MKTTFRAKRTEYWNLPRSGCVFKSLFNVGLPLQKLLYLVFGDELRWWWWGEWPSLVVVFFDFWNCTVAVIESLVSFFGEFPQTIVFAFGASNCWSDCCPVILRCFFSKSGEPGRLGGKASRMVPVAWILLELCCFSARPVFDSIDLLNEIDLGLDGEFVFDNEIAASI